MQPILETQEGMNIYSNFWLSSINHYRYNKVAYAVASCGRFSPACLSWSPFAPLLALAS